MGNLFGRGSSSSNAEKFKDLYVVITGASTGIGEGTALYLDAKGFNVIATVRLKEDGERLKHKSSSRLQYVLLELSSGDSIECAVKSITEIVGPKGLYGLVNNAGMGGGSPIEFADMTAFRLVMEVNFFAPLALIQKCIPLLRLSPIGARIVNVGSMADTANHAFLTSYNASKAALSAASDTIRGELQLASDQSFPIHVSHVAPGAFKSEMTTSKFEAGKEAFLGSAKQRERYGVAVNSFIENFGKLPKPESLLPVMSSIEHALVSPRPRTRYSPGVDAKVFAVLAWLLPRAVLEWIMYAQIKSRLTKAKQLKRD
mmetsp:Transcript_41308/g.68923  ORF Transcript_41308/g.68923 Transcript_41308/m.68923 type:complete len:315 (+) Transcript_41308:230-1174(+)